MSDSRGKLVEMMLKCFDFPELLLRMPFGVWDESDWRPVNYGLPGIPSSCVSELPLYRFGQARRSRTCVASVTSSSSLGFTGKALRRSVPGIYAFHISLARQLDAEFQRSPQRTQGVQGLSSPFTSCCDSDDEDEYGPIHDYSIDGVAGMWELSGRAALPIREVLENLQKELGSFERGDPGVDEDAKQGPRLTIGEAVQLIANGTVIGAVAEDMLKKLKTGGVRSGIPRRYVVTYELYGLLTNKVRDVLDQMEISQTEAGMLGDVCAPLFGYEKRRCMLLATSMLPPLRELLAGRAPLIPSCPEALKLRENDEDFITKLKSAADTADTAIQPDETEVDQQEPIVGEMDKLLTREELKNLLRDVISGLDRFRWQDLANDLKKWCTTGETSDNVVRRLLEDTVELQREAVSVLALSKILAEETLSSRILLAARALADFNDAVDREMGLMLERFGIDPALISRTYTHSASLLDAFASKKSLSSLDREEETESVLADSQPFATTAILSDMEKAMVKQRDHQRRVHKKVKGDLTALMQEHRRKVELNRSLYDHLMMTTMRDERTRKGGQEVGNENYLQSAMQRQPTHESQELEVDELQTPPDIPPEEEDAAEADEASKPPPAAPGRPQKGKGTTGTASGTRPSGGWPCEKCLKRSSMCFC
ncbi:URC1 [Symbiodinium sp. CCMP2592]|nr:URC1 [Symbiodinium sp. CCMP2592]